MTPAARLQAAIECLELIAEAARTEGPAADTILDRYFRARRYAGSGDRRAVRELVYTAVRAIGEPPPTGRAAMIGYARAQAPELLTLFGAGGHGPRPLAPGEPEAAPGPAPAWLMPHLARAFGADAPAEATALLARAPLDLRVNLLKADRAQFGTAHRALTPTPLSPWGLRGDDAALPREALERGEVEIQDEGSQLVALACAAQPGETVVDLCAGAGGKTLALAAAMGNQGRIVACDVDRRRLGELAPRAARAGVSIAEPRLLSPPAEADALADMAGRADLVLVDAPCSGTGTWRRNPEARWRLTPERLARLTALQDRLLGLAATLAAPGGRVVYAVCSVLAEEGPDRAATFLARHPSWSQRSLPWPDPLTPRRTGTDGFSMAVLTPIC